MDCGDSSPLCTRLHKPPASSSSSPSVSRRPGTAALHACTQATGRFRPIRAGIVNPAGGRPSPAAENRIDAETTPRVPAVGPGRRRAGPVCGDAVVGRRLCARSRTHRRMADMRRFRTPTPPPIPGRRTTGRHLCNPNAATPADSNSNPIGQLMDCGDSSPLCTRPHKAPASSSSPPSVSRRPSPAALHACAQATRRFRPSLRPPQPHPGTHPGTKTGNTENRLVTFTTRTNLPGNLPRPTRLHLRPSGPQHPQPIAEWTGFAFDPLTIKIGLVLILCWLIGEMAWPQSPGQRLLVR